MSDELIIEGVAETPNGFRRPFVMRIPLRPLFAAVAMNGLLSNSSLKLANEGEIESLAGIKRVAQAADVSVNRDAIANASWLMADALLKRREEKLQGGEVAE